MKVQCDHSLELAKQSFEMKQKEVAKLMKDRDELRLQVKNSDKGQPSMSIVPISAGKTENVTTDLDAQYAIMKMNYLQNKMSCGTCKQAENDMVLPCGHMFCKNCIDELFRARARACPQCRRRLS